MPNQVEASYRLYRLFAGLLCALALAACQSPDSAGRLRSDLRQVIGEARDEVYPALVHVNVITTVYEQGVPRKGRGSGSGTIITDDGHVLTNYHVVRRGKRYECTLADKTRVEAQLVGSDPLTDLAVLKLNMDKIPESALPLPVASFGDSNSVQVGDYVLAMGSPLSLSRSVTLGIVSNTERVLTRGGDTIRFAGGQRTGLFNQWIQHDALINPGSSGGPLVNLEGQIVGVNARGGRSIGYAIPSNLARQVADEIMQHEKVPRSFIGVSIIPIEGTGYDRGVIVEGVTEGGPAEQAGLRAGDLITAINGEPVTVRFEEQIPPLAGLLVDMPIGSEITFDLLRPRTVGETEGAEQLQVTVGTREMKPDRGRVAALRRWGFAVVEITEKLARDYRLDSAEGVVIGGVRPGDAAALAEPELKVGDIIERIDDVEIRSLEDMIDAYKQRTEGDAPVTSLLVYINREGKRIIALLEPRDDKNEDPPRELPKAWIGIATQPLTPKLARQIEPSAPGFRVTRVYPDTNAAAAGLQVGDIVYQIGDQVIAPRRIDDAGLFDLYVRRLDIGDDVTLKLLRDGKQKEITIELEATRYGAAEARRDTDRDFEMTVRELTFFDRDEARLPDEVTGVGVIQVEQAGWAGIGGLRPGDIILRIRDHDIKGIKSYRQAIAEIKEQQPQRVVFVVLRGVSTKYLFIEPDWKPEAVEDVVDVTE